jgi:diguanylate cyclase (GGDEF)-like protein/PAS domain S-box-containing protein
MFEDRWVVHFERRFTSTYMVALGVLAGFAIFTQLVGLYQISQRDLAAHMVNVAGRQAMLGQQVAKLAVLSKGEATDEQRKAWSRKFSDVVNEWATIQEGLRTRDASLGLGGRNTAEIQARLQELKPLVDRVTQAGKQLAGSVNGPQDQVAKEPFIQEILASDPQYLEIMSKTTGLYELEAGLQGLRVQWVQVLFPTVMLLILFVLGACIFRPAGKKMNETLEALRDSERRFHAFMDTSPVVAYMKDESGRYVYVNQSFRRLFRANDPDLIGKSDQELLPEEIAKKLRDSDRSVLADNRSAELMEQIPSEKGDMRHWLAVKFPFTSQSGQKFLGGTSIDITERVITEEALRASEKRWQLALRGANDGLWDWNAVTGEVYYSARWKQILGYGDHEMANVTDEWDLRVHPDDLPRVKVEIDAHLTRKTPYYVSEYRMRARDGNYRWVLARGQAVWDDQGRPLRMAGSHTDITDRKKTEEQLSNEAAVDQLTQISNRRRLLEQVATTFHTSRASGRPLCVCVCDIDNFKQVNDDCGHAVGDRVLSTFAQILREALRSGDIAGRLGGDEFCIVLPATREAEAASTMERVRTRLETMLFAQRDGKPFHVTATFGLAELSGRLESEAELMDAADQALYAGKRNGRNRVNLLRRDEKTKTARFSS